MYWQDVRHDVPTCVRHQDARCCDLFSCASRRLFAVG